MARNRLPVAPIRLFLFACCTLAAPPAVAQTWRATPQLSLRETFTDNAELSSAALAQRRVYSDITTGLSLERLGPRLSFLIDYRLRSYLYAGESRLNNNQNFLNSRAALELIDNRMFVDLRANINQQSRSAFGAPVTADGSGTNANQAETKTVQISPYLRGTLSDRAIYQFRFNAADSRTGDNAVADSRTTEWLGLLSSAPSAGRLGWLVDGSAQTVRNDDAGERRNNRVRISLVYPLIPTLTLSAITGYEDNSLADSRGQSGSTNGVGLEWNPGPRTRLIASGQRRFFGNGHDVTFSHRTALTSWRVSSSRDVVLSQNLATSGQISISELIADILASSIPDPAARSAAVSQRLGQAGVPLATSSSQGFLTSRPTLTRQQNASVVLLGARNTVTLTLSRRDQLALGSIVSTADSFNASDSIRQTTASLSWVYRLTPLTSLTLALSNLKSIGLAGSSLESEQRLQSLFFNTSLGPRTTASVGLSQDHFDSSRAASYRANSVTGSLSVRF